MLPSALYVNGPAGSCWTSNSPLPVAFRERPVPPWKTVVPVFHRLACARGTGPPAGARRPGIRERRWSAADRRSPEGPGGRLREVLLGFLSRLEGIALGGQGVV